MGFFTAERAVAGLHHEDMDVRVSVYADSHSHPSRFIFSLDHKGFTTSIQTKREGLAAIRSAIDEALERTS